MRIVLANNKGGVGKSTIAYSLALELGYLFITNEPRSPALKIFKDNHALILSSNDSIDNLDKSLNVVFDLKGNTDGKLVKEALISADKIIVPVIYKDIDDIFPMEESIYSIQEIEKYNKNILLIANDIQSNKEFECLKSQLSNFFNYPIFRLNKAKAFPRSIKESKSLSDYIKEDKLRAYSYRNAIRQFKLITNSIL